MPLSLRAGFIAHLAGPFCAFCPFALDRGNKIAFNYTDCQLNREQRENRECVRESERDAWDRVSNSAAFWNFIVLRIFKLIKPTAIVACCRLLLPLLLPQLLLLLQSISSFQPSVFSWKMQKLKLYCGQSVRHIIKMHRAARNGCAHLLGGKPFLRANHFRLEFQTHIFTAVANTGELKSFWLNCVFNSMGLGLGRRDKIYGMVCAYAAIVSHRSCW